MVEWGRDGLLCDAANDAVFDGDNGLALLLGASTGSQPGGWNARQHEMVW